MKTKITLKQFKLFAKEVKRWLKVLGVDGWEIYYIHIEDMAEDSLATVTWDLSSRSATFALATTWRDHPKRDDDEVRDIAKHEAIHLFLARLTTLAESRYVTAADIEEEVHNLIGILQKAL
jgi:hypothetical protein